MGAGKDKRGNYTRVYAEDCAGSSRVPLTLPAIAASAARIASSRLIPPRSLRIAVRSQVRSCSGKNFQKNRKQACASPVQARARRQFLSPQIFQHL